MSHQHNSSEGCATAIVSCVHVTKQRGALSEWEEETVRRRGGREAEPCTAMPGKPSTNCGRQIGCWPSSSKNRLFKRISVGCTHAVSPVQIFHHVHTTYDSSSACMVLIDRSYTLLPRGVVHDQYAVQAQIRPVRHIYILWPQRRPYGFHRPP